VPLRVTLRNSGHPAGVWLPDAYLQSFTLVDRSVITTNQPT
jgi:hypothetical protein